MREREREGLSERKRERERERERENRKHTDHCGPSIGRDVIHSVGGGGECTYTKNGNKSSIKQINGKQDDNISLSQSPSLSSIPLNV